VWLTKEEEQGYYAGFSNEGLWPLCHIVHTRPIFRPDDWSYYLEANQKFADTVLDQIKDAEAPLVLIQDYHFAPLPALIKAERPDARVAIFWHIPWPNFEAFGICPWQQELLLGMLGADLIGFHTQYYCNNFLETVDRALEARIDWEHFAVTRGEHTTYVKPFPISVAPEFVDDPPRVSRAELLRRLGITAEFLGVGVERIDYTKGLPERLVLWRHAVPNGLAPTFQITALNLAYLAGGIVVVESVFAWPGLGLYTVRAIASVDFPAIAGVTLVMGAAYVVVNALVDLAQVAADPRLRAR